MPSYQPRLIEPLLSDLLAEVPAVMIVGPRAVGKTTTARRFAKTVISLDRPAEGAAFAADPDAALKGLKEPVLLDEWQVVPEVLGAVKRTVDGDPHPGRFILAGSVRAETQAESWPGTGRLVRLPMYPMTVAEQKGWEVSSPLLDRIAASEMPAVPDDTPDLRGYVDLALRGGFPQPALSLSDRIRSRWLQSYVDQVITRDSEEVDGGRDPERLRRYLQAWALNTAGVVEHKTLYDAAGINRKTALAYDRLLFSLMIVQEMPAWTSNRLKRLTLSPKRYLLDASMLVGILGLAQDSIMKNGDLLGRTLDTFVASQLRAQSVSSRLQHRLYHLRKEQGRREVDIVAESGAGDVIGVEVKATSSPTPDDARHLRWVASKLGERCLAGVLFHTGPRPFKIDEKVSALPISCLWS